jgi:hypothetical protein
LNDEIGQEAADSAYYALRSAIKSLQLLGSPDLTITGEGGATSITTKDGTLQMSAGVPVVWSVTAEDGSETHAAIISETGLLTAKKNGVVKVTAQASGSSLSGSALIAISGQEGALLSGPASALSGEAFKLNFGLNNLTSDVYAIDLTVRYDAAKVEFVSGISLVDGFSIVLDQEGESGAGEANIRFLAAGAGQAISNTDNLLELSFKAKDVSATVDINTITVDNVIISDGVTETPVSPTSHNVKIEVGDKTALSAAIAAANSRLIGAIEGSFLGQYAPGSKAPLETQLAAANVALADPELSPAGIQEAVTQLAAATIAFDRTLRTLSGASVMTIGDLAVVARHYGQSNADANWTLYKALGITTPRPIGVQDLAAVAYRIIGN